MQKEINLEEIFDKYIDSTVYDVTEVGTIKVVLEGTQVPDIIQAMKEAVKQALELAAENAVATEKTILKDYSEAPYIRRKLITVVAKQSILNTINQVK